MRWAVAFLPAHIRQLMNLLARTELYTGSGLRVVWLAVRLLAISVGSGLGLVPGRFGKPVRHRLRRHRVDRAVRLEGQLIHVSAGRARDRHAGEYFGRQAEHSARTLDGHADR